MTLRAEDLKPGDVVRMDLVVHRHDNYLVTFKVKGGLLHFDDDDLAAGNAERVQRPRPVRKGDVLAIDGREVEFIATSGGCVVFWEMDGATLGEFAKTEPWSHANGDPIDWEASE